MLHASARLRSPEDFRAVVRAGTRAGRPTLVVHVRRTERPGPRAGFVVSKAVGNAVVRNRVKRRLRHLVAAELRSPVAPVDVVVRALPAASTQPERLSSDFASAWKSAVTGGRT